jgi:hypothetical protein
VGRLTKRVVIIKRQNIEFRRGPFVAKRKWEYPGQGSAPKCLCNS